MENEGNILDLSDADISDLSQDEAKGRVDRLMRDARSDPKHPYMDGHSPDHRKVVEKVSKLYQVASPEPELQTNAEGEVLIQQFPPAMVKAMEEGLQEQQAKQAALIADAQREMDTLVNDHGYGRDEIPSNIEPWQVNLLKAQRLNLAPHTPDSLQQLSNILEKESYAVKFDPKLREAITSLSMARHALGEDSAAEFSAIVERVIFMIDAGHDKIKKEFNRGRKANNGS